MVVNAVATPDKAGPVKAELVRWIPLIRAQRSWMGI